MNYIKEYYPNSISNNRDKADLYADISYKNIKELMVR